MFAASFPKASWIATGAVLLAGCGGGQPKPVPGPPTATNELRGPEAFAAISDRDERARALFMEASKVLFHPRCRNCHPAGDTPLQGDDGRPHDPPVARGPKDEGLPALRCNSCHQDKNLELARVPGAPKWHVAPKSMAWVDRTPRAVCEQLKDRTRNGDRNLAQIVDHAKHDELVAWGWAPGHDRTPAPGTQAMFGELVAAWVAAGAACPGGDKP